MRISENFTPRALMEQVIEAMGEGEIQDSLVIGFLQFIKSETVYFCRICNHKFKLAPAQPGDIANDNQPRDS